MRALGPVCRRIPPRHGTPRVTVLRCRGVRARRTLFQETVNVHNFKNIPIGKFSRFEKPEPFGRWTGTWDGTVYTRRVRQSTQFEKEIGKGH